MGKDKGFKEFERQTAAYKPVEVRTRHWNEFAIPSPSNRCRFRAPAA
jgi:hypothetical protein